MVILHIYIIACLIKHPSPYFCIPKYCIPISYRNTTNATLPTINPAEKYFRYITKIIIELEESKIKFYAKERCKSMYGPVWLIPHTIHDLKFKHVVTRGLTEVIGYIQYHKYKVDHTTWLTFDKDKLLLLRHTTYTTPLGSIVDPDPRYSKAVLIWHLRYLQPQPIPIIC